LFKQGAVFQGHKKVPPKFILKTATLHGYIFGRLGLLFNGGCFTLKGGVLTRCEFGFQGDN